MFLVTPMLQTETRTWEVKCLLLVKWVDTIHLTYMWSCEAQLGSSHSLILSTVVDVQDYSEDPFRITSLTRHSEVNSFMDVKLGS